MAIQGYHDLLNGNGGNAHQEIRFLGIRGNGLHIDSELAAG